MPELVVETYAEGQQCFDPECFDPRTGERSWADPEQDGDHKYFSCPTCGNDFGFVRLQTQTLAVDSGGGSCSIGVPEEIRRASSSGMETAMAQKAKAELPLLQIGRVQT